MSHDLTSGWPQYKAEVAMNKALTKENELLQKQLRMAEAQIASTKKLMYEALDVLHAMGVHGDNPEHCALCDVIASLSKDLCLLDVNTL